MRRSFAINRDSRQTAGGVDLQHRQIGQAVRPHQQGFKHAAILQGDDNLVGIVNDVFIGDDVAPVIHDHTGTERADLQLVMSRTVKPAVIDVNHGGAARRTA